MKKFISAIAAALMCFAGTTQADCNHARCVSTIDKMYVSTGYGGSVRLSFNDDMTPLNCTLANGVYITLLKSHQMYDEYFAMILAAENLSDSLFYRVVEGSSNCEVQYISNK